MEKESEKTRDSKEETDEISQARIKSYQYRKELF